MKTLILVSALALLTACKSTTFTHTWPDGTQTAVTDRRLLHKQEADVSFAKETNGTVTVRGSVSSSADADAIKAIYEAGKSAGMKAAGVP